MFRWHVWAGVTLYNKYVIGDSYGLNRIHRKIHMDTHTTLVHTYLISTDKSKEPHKYSLQKPETQNQSSRLYSGSVRILDMIRFDMKILWGSMTVHDKR